MPRLPPSLFWRARREISPLAAQLLPACRDLQSAANELRWIREHVQDTKSPIPAKLRVWMLVEKRAKGVPLQYVLGTQPFGHLEIKCRSGVLIPRPETEAYTLHLATPLSQQSHPAPSSLSILDLCTGTGCIPLLLLHSLLTTNPSTPTPPPIHIHGIDISPQAISLARANHAHNIALGHLPPAPQSSPRYKLTFSQHDIFSPTLLHNLPPFQKIDLLVSNPPYISHADFARTTARAVRNHEPRLALVPPPPPLGDRDPTSAGYQYQCQPQDIFYARLLEIVSLLKPERVLMEVGGWEQALRVVGLVTGTGDGEKGVGGGCGDVAGKYEVEVWRDEPAVRGKGGERVEVGGREVVVRGVGKGRAVYLVRRGSIPPSSSSE
ncbi:S-adenosyl-L-methionine-dependent methyltransferase [Parachaetomium inaequale]|uniref:S-adenosyl-L-methionine-dependent methyltransferase n=1 Tax=Parachaetomium inaequale TaxID=2588326 RepID=A0AAN6SWG9_9PEZI|nr:S-adenosyl-L-methionine-dependent methyltransferase [Parachaetomium inaequale]